MRSLERLGRLPSIICICQGSRQHIGGQKLTLDSPLQGLQVQDMQLALDVLADSNRPSQPAVTLMGVLAAWGV